MSIQSRISHVQQLIAQATARSGRNVEDVKVIGVTKYVSVARTVEAVEAGVKHIGENRWQVAKDKWNYIHEHTVEGQASPIWHFIGSLQRNKVKDVVGRFQYIHSLDRLSLAEAIQEQAAKLGLIVNCFIQVNVSGEQSKQGMSAAEVPQFVEELKAFPNIVPVGLMTMAPFEGDPEQTRVVFRNLRELRDQLVANSNGTSTVKELSMGMSNDFEVAIEEGATFVRLGTILIGTEEDEA